jgi:diadenosine tetraphosphate (Ap4A) HIT family hydrolase
MPTPPIFTPPEEFIVFESEHWRVNQRVDAKLPGYLMMAPKDPAAKSFATITTAALTEMGPVLAKVTRAIEENLRPQHFYVGRYGHMSGNNLHFHIIPIYNWMAEAFRNDSRYRALQQFYTPGVYTSGKDTGFDGAEMTLFVWRELAESSTPPKIHGPTVKQAIDLLRQALA